MGPERLPVLGARCAPGFAQQRIVRSRRPFGVGLQAAEESVVGAEP
jgi:hypothetical protein